MQTHWRHLAPRTPIMPARRTDADATPTASPTSAHTRTRRLSNQHGRSATSITRLCVCAPASAPTTGHTPTTVCKPATLVRCTTLSSTAGMHLGSGAGSSATAITVWAADSCEQALGGDKARMRGTSDATAMAVCRSRAHPTPGRGASRRNNTEAPRTHDDMQSLPHPAACRRPADSANEAGA